MSLDEEILALSPEKRAFVEKAEGKAEKSQKLDCNEICQDCRAEARRRLIACVRTANSPEAQADCQRVYFEDYNNC